MIGIIIAAIIAVLVIGLVFKLAKVAIILALIFGAVVLVRNFVAQKRIK
jgi:Flp pilus assembly protein TadB